MYDRFYPGKVWTDTEGKRIQAHGGSVMFIDGTYYWYGENKEFTNNRARQVGMKKPNVWGLYDMHGNVWEWTTTKIGNCYKRCGGSWYDGYDRCLATTFHCDNEYYKNDTIGFRLVAEPLGKNLDKLEE